MIAKEIRDYLSTQIQDVDIFYSRVVASPDTIVSVLDYYGRPPELQDNYDHPRFQIRVRAPTYDESKDLCWECYSALHNLCRITVSGLEILEIVALQSPYQLELDELDRTVFQVNFEAHVYAPTTYRR
jgi:hypothetical protein